MRKIYLAGCMLFLWQFATAQTAQISGRVISGDDNNPMPGVTVIIKGTTQGTITGTDGTYNISASPEQVLQFSYLGYLTQEAQILTRTVIDVTMVPDAETIEELVVVGYGVMRKSDLTGSVASIRSEALQKTPAAGLDQALQGRAAGVTVNANSGQPGQAAQVRIRGIGTVNGADPLYVVDGVIVDNINFLSPNDIKSTEILKDASSAAIYGSRAANGVILVTTKTGSDTGRSIISFNTYVGVQNRWNKLDLMKSREFAETLIKFQNVASQTNYYEQNGFNAWLSAYRLGTSSYYPVIRSDSNPNGLDYSSIETDWQDEVFRKNAVIQNYHLSIDGGSVENTAYSISATYFNQEGTVIGSDYNRITIRLNTSHKVNKWLRVGENLSFMTSHGRNAMNNDASPGASILSAALAMAPWDPTHYPQGSVNGSGKDLSGQISASSNFKNVTNPFSMVQNSEPMDKYERWVGDVFLEFTPIEGLTYKTDLSLDLTNHRSRLFKYAYEYSSYDKTTENFLQRGIARYGTVNFENIVTYARSIGKHSFSVMAGQTLQEYNLYELGASGSGIANDVSTNWYIKETSNNKTVSDGVDRSRIFSLLGRAHYTYDNRYMATFNFRADGSNKFPENLWGYFPSTALAWRISEEKFMDDMPNLSQLKLRLGWGRLGNDQINNDSFIATMATAGPYFLDYILGSNQSLANGATVLTYVNRGGKWETTQHWNAAVDFGLFRNRFTGSADFFIRDTKEMLLTVKAPAHVGNRFDPVANVGTVRNKGIELTLDYQDHVQAGGSPLSYAISGNVSFIDNKLTALNGGDRVYGDKTISDTGLSLWSFWGYKYEGIYQTDEEAASYLTGYTTVPYGAGDARYKDQNEDGIIDDKDMVSLGNPFPWLTYGLNLSAEWKGLDLQLFFQGVYGNKIYNAVRHRTEGNGVEATMSTSMRNAWWTDNTGGNIPNPNNSVNFYTSSRFIEDGSYLRLKNLQLGYTLPLNITSKAGISRCRFYVSVSNLFTVTNYTGYDPEVTNGVDYGNYPQSRTVMFGANITF